VAAIAASIKEWGWTSPALVGEDGGLIAGHARVLAARQLGIAEIPVMVAAGWSEAQRDRGRIRNSCVPGGGRAGQRGARRGRRDPAARLAQTIGASWRGTPNSATR
jgi:hypothetical protein